MRALTFLAPAGDSGQTTIEEVAEPRPGSGEVAIAVRAAGVNFVDVLARRGDERYAPSWPHRPGHEVAGTIAAVGEGVEELALGERVVATTPGGGGLAEVAIADARLVARIPDGLGDAHAATAPAVLSTALLLLTDVGRWKPGESVLMHSAAGGVGSAVAQLVASLGGGMRIGTVGSADKVEAARSSGWDGVIVRDEDVAARVRESLPGGVDLILDPLGPSSVERGLELLAPLGRIVAFGDARGEGPRPLPPVHALIGASRSVGGLSVSGLSRSAPHRVVAATIHGLELLADGKVSLPVIIVPSLEEVADVHQLLAESRGKAKYVVTLAG